MDGMFYHLTILFHEANGGSHRQDMFFGRYENGYAFTSRRAHEILECNPDWHMAGDHEHRDFNHGTYSRTVKLNTQKYYPAATLTLTGVYFEDGLVEHFPDQYKESDFPKKKAS